MSDVITQIEFKTDHVRLTITVGASVPTVIDLTAAGASALAMDLSQAAANARELSASQASVSQTLSEQTYAPRATLADSGLDILSGSIVLKLQDEFGGAYTFRVDPNALVLLSRQILAQGYERDTGSSRH